MYEFNKFKVIHYSDRLRAICRGELPLPVTIEIDLTNACNHRCTWCMDRSYNARINDTLKETPLLKFASEIASQGVRGIIFKGGGDPLLYYSFSKLVRDLRSKGLSLGLITNGEAINRHLEAIPYLSWVQVGLDAATVKTHQKLHNPFTPNVFNAIIDNLYQISTSVFTGIVFIIHPDNFREMAAATHIAKDIGCRSIAFKRLIGEESKKFTPNILKEIKELLSKIRWEEQDSNFQIIPPQCHYLDSEYKNSAYRVCLAHHLIGILASDGNLYPCRTLRGDADYSYGSIYRDSFHDIWYGDKRRAVLKKIARHECAAKCLDRTFYLRYDHYNQLLEYLSKGRDKVGHVDFL